MKFRIDTGQYAFETEYEGTLEEFLEELSTTKWWITDEGHGILVYSIQYVMEVKK